MQVEPEYEDGVSNDRILVFFIEENLSHEKKPNLATTQSSLRVDYRCGKKRHVDDGLNANQTLLELIL